MRESSLVFRPYLVCPLYLLALLTSPTKFVGEPGGDKDNLSVRRHACLTTDPSGREDSSAGPKMLPGNLKN